MNLKEYLRERNSVFVFTCSNEAFGICYRLGCSVVRCRETYDEGEYPAFADEGISKRSWTYATRKYNGRKLVYGCGTSSGRCWSYCGVSWVGIFNFCYDTIRMMSY